MKQLLKLGGRAMVSLGDDDFIETQWLIGYGIFPLATANCHDSVPHEIGVRWLDHRSRCH